MRLVPMSPSTFDAFVERLTGEYADDKVRSGNWPEEDALERSRTQIAKLLPQGVETENQALFELASDDEDDAVGALWLAVIDDAGTRKGFIYDLWIRPDVRRRGLGRQAMREAEAWARAQGLEALSLHVFGENSAALSLYQNSGYRITNINMTKTLT